VITFDCPCGKKLQVRDEFAGKQGKCPVCGRTLSIPEHTEPAVPSDGPAYRLAPGRDTTADDFDTGAPAAAPRDEKPRRARRPVAEGEDWEPDEDLCNHAGGELGRKDDFFAPPPAEIGAIQSAHTSLRRDKRPLSPGVRLAVALVGGAAGLLIGLLIAVNLKSPFFQILWPVGLSGLGLGILLAATRFSHTCTYVGERGVARYACKGHRGNVSDEVFLFDDATELRTGQTRHYTNGAYTHTAYSYTWTDVTGRPRFTVAGSHNSEQNTPPAKDLFHFATAAEKAWTIYLLHQVQAQLKTSGSIYFGLGGKDWVRLSEDCITLNFKGKTTECHADDIGQVKIDQGTFSVKRKDAKEGWFTSEGVFKFPYQNLANAQLFLILLHELVGVQVNE
jgi:hypothetical protein